MVDWISSQGAAGRRSVVVNEHQADQGIKNWCVSFVCQKKLGHIVR